MSTIDRDEYIKYEIEQGIQRFQISDLYKEVKELDIKIDKKFDKLESKMEKGFSDINNRFHTLYISIVFAAIIPTAISIIMHYLLK